MASSERPLSDNRTGRRAEKYCDWCEEEVEAVENGDGSWDCPECLRTIEPAWGDS